MRLLALDVGDRRIGVAISDSLGILASPLATIRRRSEERDMRAVLDLADEREAGGIVVGMPLSLSGERGPQARRVERFRDALAARTRLPVAEHDERYSTAEAERLLRETGADPSKDRARLDAAAAAVILQAYLDANRARRPDAGCSCSH